MGKIGGEKDFRGGRSRAVHMLEDGLASSTSASKPYNARGEIRQYLYWSKIYSASMAPLIITLAFPP